MLVADLLHSCANERVAEAAVASIGGDFADMVQAAANDRGVSVGTHTSDMVRSFAREASERDWRVLHESVKGHDVPVLHGLRYILSKPVRPGDPLRRPGSARTPLHNFVGHTIGSGAGQPLARFGTL